MVSGGANNIMHVLVREHDADSDVFNRMCKRWISILLTKNESMTYESRDTNQTDLFAQAFCFEFKCFDRNGVKYKKRHFGFEFNYEQKCLHITLRSCR